MKTYIYPQNLKAAATLWLWSLRDFAIIGIGILISVVAIAQAGFVFPLAFILTYAFLTIRLDDQTILDFLRYATKYFITTQQYFEWRLL
jgi:hypothetical protein